MKYVPHIFVILISLFTSLSWTNSVIQASKSVNSNISFLRNTNLFCNSIPKNENNKKVVLRIDDVQAHYLRDISIKIAKDAFSHKAPVVFGVIPYGIEDDKEIYSFMQKNACNVELAQHGWNHSTNPPEFKNLSKDEAYEKIVKGKEVLENITSKDVVTFIPPENAYSNGTAIALKELGFEVLTGEGEGFHDYHASFYNHDRQTFVQVSEILNTCNNVYDSGNELCVILIHPRDFTTNDRLNPVKYNQYLILLDELVKRDVSFVTFRDLL